MKKTRVISQKGAVPMKKGKGVPAKKGVAKSTLAGWISGLKMVWSFTLALPWKMFARVGVLGCVFALFFVAQKAAWNYLDQPISKLEIHGSLSYLSKDDLRPVLSRALGKGFFSVDIDKLKARVEEQPWVDEAAIKRVWPNRLDIQVTEQIPVARWNTVAFLNAYGVPFMPSDVSVVAIKLPWLSGPAGMEVAVLKKYVLIREALLSHHVEVAALNLEPRGAWTLAVDDGLTVMLGREKITERLGRFTKVYKGYLKANIDKVKLIDARYTNGVSIAWNKESDKQKDT